MLQHHSQVQPGALTCSSQEVYTAVQSGSEMGRGYDEYQANKEMYSRKSLRCRLKRWRRIRHMLSGTHRDGPDSTGTRLDGQSSISRIRNDADEEGDQKRDEVLPKAFPPSGSLPVRTYPEQGQTRNAGPTTLFRHQDHHSATTHAPALADPKNMNPVQPQKVICQPSTPGRSGRIPRTSLLGWR
jgi:hypothetical protein